MKAFYCQKCDERLFFENTVCLSCGSSLGFLADLGELSVIQPSDPPGDHWSAAARQTGGLYRKCLNYQLGAACSWMIPAEDPEGFCASCRLNRTIPDLSVPGHDRLWRKMEAAKRRLVYSLLRLGLPVDPKSPSHPGGLAFDFLADASPGYFAGDRILTGHADGVITINIREADDAIREQTRLSLSEEYRTLLGHFRHESGHYYWDLLVRDRPALEDVRSVFGDEREDYSLALQRYYGQGPPPGWESRFVAFYAAAHPWEDWAETWAHYLHIIDTLETAAAGGLQINSPRGQNQQPLRDPYGLPFPEIRKDWHSLRFVINSLNRSMGMPDPYPFVLTDAIAVKLAFIHELIGKYSHR